MTTEELAKAKRLRASGLTYRAIADRLGISSTTAYRWLNPAYAERQLANARALKESYRGTCRECGASTNNGDGPGKAPALCKVCYNAARRPSHGTDSRYQAGCSCADCREAHRIAHRALKGKPPPRHGLSGYRNYGCRCSICTQAYRDEEWRRYDERKRYPSARRKQVVPERAVQT